MQNQIRCQVCHSDNAIVEDAKAHTAGMKGGQGAVFIIVLGVILLSTLMFPPLFVITAIVILGVLSGFAWAIRRRRQVKMVTCSACGARYILDEAPSWTKGWHLKSAKPVR